jgi:hypothetical protein
MSWFRRARKRLQDAGLIHKPEWAEVKYRLHIYVESEGTVVGTPRPLTVEKEPITVKYDKKLEVMADCQATIYAAIADVFQRGYEKFHSNGMVTCFHPNRIYKVTFQEVGEEDDG